MSRVVKTLNGPVKGKSFEFDGHSATAFLGIPYAKPPVGELRFKKPQPADKWTEVRDCTNFGPSCPYLHFLSGARDDIPKSEDCLLLNVFAPDKPKTKGPLPVYFYIHGGGFKIDCANLLGDKGICKYLCGKDVIVVTFNYRLGIFGFLTLQNSEVNGNFGLWDMTAALRWTKENIAAFGGDPNRITVSGQSAGSVAAEMLALSPHSRDLFDRMIMFAGTSWGQFNWLNAEWSDRCARHYAKHLGFDGDIWDTAAVLKFYKEAPAEKLALAMFPNPEFEFQPNQPLTMVPTFDGDFFPKPLDELVKEAPKKKLINGITEHEGLLFATGHPPNTSFKQIAVRSLLNLRPDWTPEHATAVAENILSEHHHPDSAEHAKECINLLSDTFFNAGAVAATKKWTERGGTVYNFIFTYFKKSSLGPMLTPILPFEAATHCMELPYFFGTSILCDYQPSEEDWPIVDTFTGYLTNFIKTGDPNSSDRPVKWHPVTDGSNIEYFHFGQTDKEHGMRDNYCGGRASYWEEVFSPFDWDLANGMFADTSEDSLLSKRTKFYNS